MKNSKMTLIEISEREFKGETFTRFAVMSWHHEGDLTRWNLDFDTMVKSGELVEVEMRPLGAVYTQRDRLAIYWNCCPDCKEPDWSPYNALELAGCIQQGGYVERVEEDTTPTFYTVYPKFLSQRSATNADLNASLITQCTFRLISNRKKTLIRRLE